MPFFNFKCRECGAENEISLTLSEKERGAYSCPACGRGAEGLERVFKPVSVSVKAQGGPAGPSAHGPGCACCPHAANS